MILQFQIKLDPVGVARWKAMSAASKGNALEAGVNAAGLLVENSARPKAAYRTGTLRRSIRTQTVRDSATKVTAYVGSDVPYARRIELGFTGADSLGRYYSQAARPYLRPALDENRDKLLPEIAAAIKQVILA